MQPDSTSVSVVINRIGFVFWAFIEAVAAHVRRTSVSGEAVRPDRAPWARAGRMREQAGVDTREERCDNAKREQTAEMRIETQIAANGKRMSKFRRGEREATDTAWLGSHRP